MSTFFKAFMIIGWVFLVLPMLFLGSCAAVTENTNSLDTGVFAAFFSCIFASVIFFRIYSAFAKRAANKLVESVASEHGLKNEYFCYNDMSNHGFIIDNTQQKVYIGKANKGVVLSFPEISSIQWKDVPVGSNGFRHELQLMTTNFNFPSVDFVCPSKSSQEEAYNKIRAALKFS